MVLQTTLHNNDVMSPWCCILRAVCLFSNDPENVTSATNFYKTLPQVSATSNGTVQYGKGRAVDLNSAYPNQGSSTSLDSLKGTYGDDSNTLKLGNTTNANLKTENSLRGEAYRTLVGSTKTTANIKPDDSIFDGHKDFWRIRISTCKILVIVL